MKRIFLVVILSLFVGSIYGEDLRINFISQGDAGARIIGVFNPGNSEIINGKISGYDFKFFVGNRQDDVKFNGLAYKKVPVETISGWLKIRTDKYIFMIFIEGLDVVKSYSDDDGNNFLAEILNCNLIELNRLFPGFQDYEPNPVK